MTLSRKATYQLFSLDGRRHKITYLDESSLSCLKSLLSRNVLNFISSSEYILSGKPRESCDPYFLFRCSGDISEFRFVLKPDLPLVSSLLAAEVAADLEEYLLFCLPELNVNCGNKYQCTLSQMTNYSNKSSKNLYFSVCLSFNFILCTT